MTLPNVSLRIDLDQVLAGDREVTDFYFIGRSYERANEARAAASAKAASPDRRLGGNSAGLV